MTRVLLALLLLLQPAQASPYVDRLVAVARDQYQKYNAITESTPPLKDQIAKYWTGIGLKFPGVDTPWSAVFVSWCVKKAGATKEEFRFDSLHAVYIRAAIQNKLHERGVFRAFEIKDVSPSPGDIVCENRGGGKITYAEAANRSDYKSHGAIVVSRDGSTLVTIGGNEHDSVGRRVLTLQPDGTIAQREKNPYICVIRNLK